MFLTQNSILFWNPLVIQHSYGIDSPFIGYIGDWNDDLPMTSYKTWWFSSFLCQTILVNLVPDKDLQKSSPKANIAYLRAMSLSLRPGPEDFPLGILDSPGFRTCENCCEILGQFLDRKKNSSDFRFWFATLCQVVGWEQPCRTWYH
jgi:hypothetical protein